MTTIYNFFCGNENKSMKTAAVVTAITAVLSVINYMAQNNLYQECLGSNNTSINNNNLPEKPPVSIPGTTPRAEYFPDPCYNQRCYDTCSSTNEAANFIIVALMLSAAVVIAQCCNREKDKVDNSIQMSSTTPIVKKSKITASATTKLLAKNKQTGGEDIENQANTERQINPVYGCYY
jgi:hypothetical protein